MSEQNKALENTGSVLNDALSATVEASRSVMMNELPQMVPVLVQAEEQFSINDSWLTHLSESQINYREKGKVILIDSYFHKIIAFAISLVLHLVVVVVLAWNSNWEKSGIAQDSSSGGIEISLSSLAVEPAALKKKQALVEKTPVQEDLHRAGILQQNPEQQSTTELSENEERLPVVESSEGGGIPLTEKNYISTLRHSLERHKKYPYQARRLRQEGTATAYFELDRNGNVLESRLQKSSGFELLDKEVLAMIERAQPLPAMPDDMEKETLVMVLPVQFVLQ